MLDDIQIFIPTKGRLNNQKTYKILSDLGLKPKLVVEPQEAEETTSWGYKYIVLPENNKGITYSRNFILKIARNYNFKYVCMIDDDISKFGYIKNKKRVQDNNAFIDALQYFKKVNMCGTMQYTQFAWCQPKSIVYNRCLEVVMFLYMPQIENKLFEENTIEDRDFSLDIILDNSFKKDIKTFRLNHLYFHCPSIGTNKGGIESSSRYQKQIEWSKKMEKKWGTDICKYIIKKNKMPDIKINWKQIDKKIKNNLQQAKLELI